MDGDDLDQVGVALQAHDVRVRWGGAVLDLGEQPANQRVLAVGAATGGLQQLGQVQKVGQAPLAVGGLAPARGQV